MSKWGEYLCKALYNVSARDPYWLDCTITTYILIIWYIINLLLSFIKVCFTVITLYWPLRWRCYENYIDWQWHCSSSTCAAYSHNIWSRVLMDYPFHYHLWNGSPAGYCAALQCYWRFFIQVHLSLTTPRKTSVVPGGPQGPGYESICSYIWLGVLIRMLLLLHNVVLWTRVQVV